MKLPRAKVLPFVTQEAGPHFRAGRTYLLRGLYLGISGTGLALLARYTAAGDSGTFARQLYNTFYITTYVAVCLMAPVLTVHAVFRDKVAGLASVIATAPVTPMDYCLGRLLGQMAALGSILVVGAPLFIAMIFLNAGTPGEMLKGVTFLGLGALLSSSLALGRALDAESFPAAVASSYALSLFPGCLTPLVSFPYFATNPNFHPALWAFIALGTAIPLVYNLARAQILYRRRFVAEGAAVPVWQTAREGRYRGPIRGNPVLWWEKTRAGRILEKGFGRADSLSGAVRILTGLAVVASLIPLCLHPAGVALLFGLGVLAAAAQAASSVTTDREQKVWPTLLATALTPSQIVYGKLAGIILGLRYVWLAAALGGGIHLMLSVGGATLPTALLLGWGLGLASFGLMLVSTGLHASLASPTTAKAMARTLGLGLVLGAPPFLWEGTQGVPLQASAWLGIVALWAAIGIVLLVALPGRLRRAALQETR